MVKKSIEIKNFCSIIKNGDLKEVVKIADLNNIKLNRYENYYLVLAAEYGHLDILMYLETKGIPVKSNLHHEPNSAIEEAIVNGHFNVVVYLYEKYYKYCSYCFSFSKFMKLADKSNQTAIAKFLFIKITR